MPSARSSKGITPSYKPLIAAALLLGAVTVGASSSWAQGASSTVSLSSRDSAHAQRATALVVDVPRIDRPPRIDGVLDDAVWVRAAKLVGFTESEPNPGITPADTTIGFVAYDRDKLYFAVIAKGNSRRRRATVTPRDNAFIGPGDDGITLRLDTFHDNRRAYVLEVNPRGVQQDGVAREGAGTSMQEDFVWDAAGVNTDSGYVIEVAIPFTSLHFPNTDSFDIGFNLLRHYALGSGDDSWSPRRRGNPCEICQQGVLKGIRDVATRKTLDLRPYIVGARAGERLYDVTSVPDGEQTWPTLAPGRWQRTEDQRRAGADARFAVARSYEINATIHPDFSQIEASPEQVRVNQRFAIYYGERRPFFTAGSNAFATAGDGIGRLGSLFYSRNVVDPSVGARLTGQSGGLSVAGLYAHDAHPVYYHYSGFESSGVDQSAPGAAEVGVLRLKQNLGDDSYAGVLVSRRQHGGGQNQLIGGDVRLRAGRFTMLLDAFHGADSLPAVLQAPATDGSCVQGYTRSGDHCRSDLYNGSASDGSLLRSEILYTDANLDLSLAAARVTPGFRDQLGSISRVGIQYLGAGANFRQYVRRAGLRDVREDVMIATTRDAAGNLLDYDIRPSVRIGWMQGTAVGFSSRFSHTTFLGQELATKELGISTGLRISTGLYVETDLRAGDHIIYDFSDPRIGKGASGNLTVFYRPIPGILINPRYTHITTSESWGGNRVADADLFVMTAQYQHTPRLGFRWFTQFSDQASQLVENPFSQRDAYLNSSILVGYELISTSFLYIGVNDERRRFEEPVVQNNGYVRTGLRVFMKATYLLRM
jgi:hypothetical protein